MLIKLIVYSYEKLIEILLWLQLLVSCPINSINKTIHRLDDFVG